MKKNHKKRPNKNKTSKSPNKNTKPLVDNDTPQSQSTTAKKNLSKKQKLTIIILVVVLLTLAVGIGLGIIIQESSVKFDNGLYYITVGTTKAHAYTVEPSIFKGKPYSRFEILNGDGLNIEDNMIWGSSASIGSEKSQKVSFYYMRNHVITFVINVAAIDKVVATRQDYVNIALHPQLNYMQTQSIVLDGTEPQIIFEGNYYGNGYSVSNVNIAKSGLFSQTINANIYDTNVKITGNIDTDGDFGGISGKADSTDIVRCTASGNINLDVVSGKINVGGLVGYYVDNIRVNDNYINNSIFRCKSDVLFNVKANKSTLALGGIVGIAENGFVDISEYTGKINVEATEMYTLDIGGIGGILRKDYSWGQIITNFDYSEKLKSACDININFSDSATIAQIGGLYGSLTNHIVFNSRYEGKINLDIDGADAYLGGAFGLANNSKINSVYMICSDITTLTTISVVKNNAELKTGAIIGYNKNDSVIFKNS